MIPALNKHRQKTIFYPGHNTKVVVREQQKTKWYQHEISELRLKNTVRWKKIESWYKKKNNKKNKNLLVFTVGNFDLILFDFMSQLYVLDLQVNEFILYAIKISVNFILLLELPQYTSMNLLLKQVFIKIYHCNFTRECQVFF